jgi:hypothetical protein
MAHPQPQTHADTISNAIKKEHKNNIDYYMKFMSNSELSILASLAKNLVNNYRRKELINNNLK